MITPNKHKDEPSHAQQIKNVHALLGDELRDKLLHEYAISFQAISKLVVLMAQKEDPVSDEVIKMMLVKMGKNFEALTGLDLMTQVQALFEDEKDE